MTLSFYATLDSIPPPKKCVLLAESKPHWIQTNTLIFEKNTDSLHFLEGFWGRFRLDLYAGRYAITTLGSVHQGFIVDT